MGRNRINKCHALCLGAPVVAVLFGLTLPGCKPVRHMVLASTATNIGVEISQNPATQSPYGKLGYQRTELAIVPSNRTTEDNVTDGNSKGNGAMDVADVVMELRYGGIFDWGPSSGIYQRLAVGSKAVEQPGASLMFSKDANGTVSQEASEALKSLTSVREEKNPTREIKTCLLVYRRSNDSTQNAIDAAIKASMNMTWDQFVDDRAISGDKMSHLLNDLKKQDINCPK